MEIFATHVVLMRNFEAVVFAPGEVLPEWAVGKVGAHCLEPDVLDAESSEDAAEPAGDDPVGDSPQDEAPAEDAEVTEVDEAEAPAVVDFTKPARRATARKK